MRGRRDIQLGLRVKLCSFVDWDYGSDLDVSGVLGPIFFQLD